MEASRRARAEILCRSIRGPRCPRRASAFACFRFRPPSNSLIEHNGKIQVNRNPIQFIRADSNNDGTVDLSDAVATLGHLFLGHVAPVCLDAADANDDGVLNLSDSIYTLQYLFAGAATPPAPFPVAGFDATPDDLWCQSG